MALLLALAALAAGEMPLPSFSGRVHDVSKKQITIETAEGNTLDFDVNKKTRVLRGKKEIAPEELQTGDPVTIEARQEFGRYLVAVTITVGGSAKTN